MTEYVVVNRRRRGAGLRSKAAKARKRGLGTRHQRPDPACLPTTHNQGEPA